MAKNKNNDITPDRYIALTETQEEYIRMYHTYFVLQWEQYEIQKHFQCSPATVSRAIKWVIDNKGRFPSEYLIAGAIHTIRERLKMNKALLDAELVTKLPDKRFIIDLNNQLRLDEERVFKLQQIVDPASNEDNGISAASVLKLISEAGKVKF